MEQEQKVSEAKKAKDALFYQTEHAAKRVSPQELEAMPLLRTIWHF